MVYVNANVSLNLRKKTGIEHDSLWSLLKEVRELHRKNSQVYADILEYEVIEMEKHCMGLSNFHYTVDEAEYNYMIKNKKIGISSDGRKHLNSHKLVLTSINEACEK